MIRESRSEIDLYAVGIMAYQMFTGSLPFNHPELVTLLMMQANQPAELPRMRNENIPEELEQLIMKLMNKLLEDRTTCAELASELRSQNTYDLSLIRRASIRGIKTVKIVEPMQRVLIHPLYGPEESATCSAYPPVAITDSGSCPICDLIRSTIPSTMATAPCSDTRLDALTGIAPNRFFRRNEINAGSFAV